MAEAQQGEDSCLLNRDNQSASHCIRVEVEIELGTIVEVRISIGGSKKQSKEVILAPGCSRDVMADMPRSDAAVNSCLIEKLSFELL